MTRVLAVIAALVLLIGFAREASAHAALVSAEPRDGAVLVQAPDKVELRFNENVTAGAVNLIDAGGQLRRDALVDAKGETITVKLPDNLPRGSEILSYRVISQDGHPVAGSVTFSIGEPTSNKVPEDNNLGIDALIWLARIGVYVGLFGGVGGVFFIQWISRQRAASALIGVALITGIAGSVASLGLQGLDVLGLPLAGMIAVAPWKIALGTSLGPALLVAIAAQVIGLLAWRIGVNGTSRALAAIALAGAGLALAASGHAATATPQALTQPAVFLHGLAVAFWLGALAPLVALLGRDKSAPLEVLQRFSAVAIPMVGILALTGLALAIIQLESFGALVTTSYGNLLLIKLGLVAALLALAALNRFRLTPALARDGEAGRPLSRSILVEGGLAVGILCVVAGWRFTAPPRSLVPDAPLAVHIHSEKAMYQVLISPGRVGSNDFVLQLMNGDGTLLQAREATLILSQPDRGIADLEREGSLGRDGYWHVGKVPLPVPGRWHLRIDALVTDFQKITLEDDMDIATR